MTFFLIGTLAVSVVGMVSLLLLKHLELTTGHVLGGRLRPVVGAAAARSLAWGQYVLPGLAHMWLRRAAHRLRALLHWLVALAVLLAERGLERTLRMLRRNTQVPPGEVQASAFLREVSAHKKQLLKSARKRAIYEDE